MSRPRPGIFSLSVLVFPKGGDCINARQRKKAKASRLEASMSRSLVSSRLTFAANAGPLVPVAAEGTSETDWLPEQRRFEPPVPLAKVRVIFGERRGRRLSAWSRKTSSFSRGDQWFESLLLYQRVSSRLRLRMNSQPILPANSLGCFLAQGMTPRSPYKDRKSVV